jgi:predicted nuclease of predicted toxin-antitoxin system
MRFLVDMPLSPKLAAWLTANGHDAIHASQAGLSHAEDKEILQHAVADQRIILTADLDFPRLLALLHSGGPGLVLFRSGEWSEAECVERLSRVLQLLPDQAFSDSVIVIEKHRIRRRPLPLS